MHRFRAWIVGIDLLAAALLVPLLFPAPAAGQLSDEWRCANSMPKKAIEACTRMIDSGRQGRALAEAYTSRGATYAQLIFFEQFNASAEELKEYRRQEKADYDEAIRIDPTYPSAHFNRGVLYATEKDYDRALADFTEAIRLGPADRIVGNDYSKKNAQKQLADYFHQRGRVYFRKDDIDRAIADYTESIRLQPEFAQAIYSRALAYKAKGDTARAEADFDRAIKLDPDLKRS